MKTLCLENGYQEGKQQAMSIYRKHLERGEQYMPHRISTPSGIYWNETMVRSCKHGC